MSIHLCNNTICVFTQMCTLYSSLLVLYVCMYVCSLCFVVLLIKKKSGWIWYVIELLFSELSSEITNYRVFYRKIAIDFNLSKQVQKLSFNDLYCCLTTKNISVKDNMP